jgi:hypothetical protein
MSSTERTDGKTPLELPLGRVPWFVDDPAALVGMPICVEHDTTKLAGRVTRIDAAGEMFGTFLADPGEFEPFK